MILVSKSKKPIKKFELSLNINQDPKAIPTHHQIRAKSKTKPKAFNSIPLSPVFKSFSSFNLKKSTSNSSIHPLKHQKSNQKLDPSKNLSKPKKFDDVFIKDLITKLKIHIPKSTISLKTSNNAHLGQRSSEICLKKAKKISSKNTKTNNNHIILSPQGKDIEHKNFTPTFIGQKGMYTKNDESKTERKELHLKSNVIEIKCCNDQNNILETSDESCNKRENHKTKFRDYEKISITDRKFKALKDNHWKNKDDGFFIIKS